MWVVVQHFAGCGVWPAHALLVRMPAPLASVPSCLRQPIRACLPRSASHAGDRARWVRRRAPTKRAMRRRKKRPLPRRAQPPARPRRLLRPRASRAPQRAPAALATRLRRRRPRPPQRRMAPRRAGKTGARARRAAGSRARRSSASTRRSGAASWKASGKIIATRRAVETPFGAAWAVVCHASPAARVGAERRRRTLGGSAGCAGGRCRREHLAEAGGAAGGAVCGAAGGRAAGGQSNVRMALSSGWPCTPGAEQLACVLRTLQAVFGEGGYGGKALSKLAPTRGKCAACPCLVSRAIHCGLCRPWITGGLPIVASHIMWGAPGHARGAVPRLGFRRGGVSHWQGVPP